MYTAFADTLKSTGCCEFVVGIRFLAFLCVKVAGVTSSERFLVSFLAVLWLGFLCDSVHLQ